MFSGFLDYDTTFSLLKKRVPSVFLPSIISSRPPVAIIYMSCQNLFLPLMPHFALHLWNISTHGHRIHLPRISGAHHDYNRVRFDILGWNAISHLHNTLYPFHVTRHCHQLSLPTVISHVPMPLGGTVLKKKTLWDMDIRRLSLSLSVVMCIYCFLCILHNTVPVFHSSLPTPFTISAPYFLMSLCCASDFAIPIIMHLLCTLPQVFSTTIGFPTLITCYHCNESVFPSCVFAIPLETYTGMPHLSSWPDSFSWKYRTRSSTLCVLSLFHPIC